MYRSKGQAGEDEALLTRRGFLGVAASAAGSAMLGSPSFGRDEHGLVLPVEVPRSRVVEVQSRHVLDGSVVHRALLSEMIESALTALTQTATPAEAWRALLKPADIVGI